MAIGRMAEANDYFAASVLPPYSTLVYSRLISTRMRDKPPTSYFVTWVNDATEKGPPPPASPAGRGVDSALGRVSFRAFWGCNSSLSAHGTPCPCVVSIHRPPHSHTLTIQSPRVCFASVFAVTRSWENTSLLCQVDSEASLDSWAHALDEDVDLRPQQSEEDRAKVDIELKAKEVWSTREEGLWGGL